MGNKDGEFTWPQFYNFPPFFTMQINEETKKRWNDIWSQLIRDYCKFHALYVLDTSAAIPLFCNERISRKLSIDAKTYILNNMSEKDQIVWTDVKSKTRCFVFWYSKEDWGEKMHKYASENGLTNSVATLKELIESDSEFKGMDKNMMMLCLGSLDLKAFERRLTEVIDCVRPNTIRWRIILAITTACTAIGAWQWLNDPRTPVVTFTDSLLNHLFFTLSIIVLVILILTGVHKRVVAPTIIAARTRVVLSDFNMSCDETGKLILKPRPQNT